MREGNQPKAFKCIMILTGLMLLLMIAPEACQQPWLLFGVFHDDVHRTGSGKETPSELAERTFGFLLICRTRHGTQ